MPSDTITKVYLLYDWWFSEYQSPNVYSSKSFKKNTPVCLAGWTFNFKDETLEERIFIKSAPIVKYDSINNHFVSIQGNHYRLMNPYPDYIESFPTSLMDFKKFLIDQSTTE